MAQPNLIPKRISALPPMDEEHIIAELENKDNAGEWAMAIDSLRRSNAEDRTEGLAEGEDAGSLYVPMNRLALRDTNGLIPASMLPMHIDDMIFGTLTVTSSKASFAETTPPGGTPHVYVSPHDQRSEGELPPPENIIYCDTTTDIQYRFTGETSTSTDINHFGFTEVPGSRAIVPQHGIAFHNGSDAKMYVAVKTPDMILRSDAGAATDIAGGDVWSSWDVVQIGPECNGDITCTERTSGANKYVELGGLHVKDDTETKQESRYKVTLQLLSKPKTDQMMSADIYTVKLVAPDIHAVSVAEMDMSGPSGAWNVLNFELDLLLQSASTTRLYLTTDMPSGTTLSAKVQNFSVVELL